MVKRVMNPFFIPLMKICDGNSILNINYKGEYFSIATIILRIPGEKGNYNLDVLPFFICRLINQVHPEDIVRSVPRLQVKRTWDA